MTSSAFVRPLHEIARCGLVVAGLLVILAPAPAPPDWVDVAGPALAGTADVSGVAWGDYDGDGDPDLYLAREADNRLFRNDGNDQFVDVTPAILADPDRGTAAAWGDADNDGDLDLYLVKPDFLDTNRFFRNDAGSFVEATTPVLGIPGSSRDATWVDVEGDGDLDLYVVCRQGSRLLRNDAGNFVESTPPSLEGVDYAEDATWGDVDLDGDADVYLTGFTEGSSRLRRNDGGAFSDATSLPITGNAQTNSAVWVDLDNDQHPDLSVLATYYDSELYRNLGDGSFVSITPGSFSDIRSHLGGQVWGDFDNDGDADLFVNQRNGYAKLLYRNDGGGNFVEVGEAPLRNTVQGAGAAAADYDGDGDLDLLVANYPGGTQLFRNDIASGNHWLEIELTGTASNRNGVGATVRVVTASGGQIREIQGGGAGGSQDGLVVHFGLGGDTEASLVQILWPSGTVQNLVSVDADARIEVTEMATVGVEDRPIPVRTRLLAATPNPFRTTTTLRYALEVPGPLRFRILDAQGRSIRAFHETGPAGPGTLVWDGRDGRGRSVPQGLYWVVMESETGRRSTKVIRLD